MGTLAAYWLPWTQRRFTTTCPWYQPHWNSCVSYFSTTMALIWIQYSMCNKSLSQHATSTAPPSASFRLAGILNTCSSFPANYGLYIIPPQTLFTQNCSLHLLLASPFIVIPHLYNTKTHVYVDLNISSENYFVCLYAILLFISNLCTRIYSYHYVSPLVTSKVMATFSLLQYCNTN